MAVKSLLDLPKIQSTPHKSKKKRSPKKSGGLSSNLSSMKAKVMKHLGKYKDIYQNVQDEDVLHDYIDHCIKAGIAAYDTETTGLDPLQDDIVGFSLYNPDSDYPIYVPINHISTMTGQRIKTQLTVEQCRIALERIQNARIDLDMFNATFDERVSKNLIGVNLVCTWDASLASRLLNENEQSRKLKDLYAKYILKGKEEVLSFGDYFEEGNFHKVPLDIAYLYGAHDAVVTFKYADYQRGFLRPDAKREDMRQLYWVFKNIEMPCVQAVTELEDAGVELDLDYIDNFLKPKYHKKLKEAKKACYEIIDMYEEEIRDYDGNVKLDNPINLDSPKQLAVIFYDIMGLESPDKKNPRGTGEKILSQMNDSLADNILEYRGLAKLVSTYIDKMPEVMNRKDGRVHCKFNQYGANTGRFSSNDPNLQNIPSHNKDIRPMFKATSSEYKLETEDNIFRFNIGAEVNTEDGWVYVDTLMKGDKMLVDNKPTKVKSVKLDNGKICVTI